jgi:NADPH:quinone reductase-like Zn-dependent oxidoreductase
MYRAITASLVAIVLSPAAIGAETMQAVVVGEGGSLKLEQMPKPEPKAGEILVRVRAASVNPVDWKLGLRASPADRMIPGRDLSGIVAAVGAGAQGFKLGDEVIAIAPGGSYAEFAAMPAKIAAPKPTKMSFEEAAGIPVVGETAWRAIVTVADVQKGQRVLVHGGAGGVGSSAVQIAKARGAYVIATASPRNHDFLRKLGADEVIDYNTVRFEDKVKDADVVVNTVDAETGSRSIKVVKPGGILVSVVGPTPPEPCAMAKIRCEQTGRVTGELLRPVVDLANQGRFAISIDQRLTLADASKAWESNRAGHTRGKIVLTVAP